MQDKITIEEHLRTELQAALDHIIYLLPLAKGYAAKNQVGANQSICENASKFIAARLGDD